LIYNILLAVLLASSLFSRGIRARQVLRYTLVWTLLFLVVITAYSYRHVFAHLAEPVIAEILPHRGRLTAPGTMAFPAAKDGHFYVEANVNGTPVRFLVDTGASSMVLSPADARRVGIAIDRLRFTQLYETANGTVKGAPVELKELSLGPVRFSNVSASVNAASLSNSLLGMSVLRRFDSYEVHDGQLIVRWH
jgi:aspartyl protease family protein